MKKFAFILLIVNCSLLISQQPTQEWVIRYPGPTNDLYGPFLEVDKQGNSYIAGTHVVNDTPKVLCVKYNTDGVQLWAKLYIYPGEAYIRPTGLALDSSGNAYVIADQGPAYYLPTNGLIVKFNSLNGSLVWAKRYIGLHGWGAFRDIKIDRLDNIYTAGWSDTSHLLIRYNTNGDSVWVRKYRPPNARETFRACTIDDSLNIIATGQRIYNYDTLLVAKYSSGGVLRWESTYAQGVNENVGIKIAADQNGSVYIGGVTVISGASVYLTLKYDRNGVQRWAKIYDAPGGGSNVLRGIVIDRLNNALFATGGAVTNGIQMATTIKYNSATGDSIWVRKDTGNNNAGNSRDLIVDSNGNVYISGETYNFPSYLPFDILTAKYSDNGNQIWRMTYNGSFNDMDIGRALRLDSLNNVYVLGTSPSSTQITDYVIIKYNQLLGIKPLSNEIPIAFRLFQNFPNPFNPNTKIRFSVHTKSYITLEVYDVLGRIHDGLIKEVLSPAIYEISFDGSGYSSGVYFYQLIADSKIIDTKKMIVLK